MLFKRALENTKNLSVSGYAFLIWEQMSLLMGNTLVSCFLC